MVAMPAVAVLGVIALFVAIVAWVTWHRAADERQSVQHHQHTLETLRHVADRRQQPSWPTGGRKASASKIRPPPRPSSAPKQSLASTRPKAPWRSGRESPKSAAPRRETVVFAEDDPGTTTTRSASTTTGRSASSPTPASGLRGSRRAGSPTGVRRRGHDRVKRTRLVVGATAVVAGVAVAGALLFGSSHTPPRPSRGSHPATAAGHGHRPPTVPAVDLTPTSPTAYSATYAAPSSSYIVAIGASALCWVMATQAATGKVVWTGTVPAGGSQSMSASGNLVVELGAPSDVSVTMDGRAVQLPTGFRSPFDLTFEAAA
jgi:hypothetical protein